MPVLSMGWGAGNCEAGGILGRDRVKEGFLLARGSMSAGRGNAGKAPEEFTGSRETLLRGKSVFGSRQPR